MIEFSQLKKEAGDIGLEIVRIDTDDYFEAVIVKNKLTELIQRLEKIFGAPRWPSEKNLSRQIIGVIQKFGGIRDGQILYFGQTETCFIFAMLWPWMDGAHVTLKIGSAL